MSDPTRPGRSHAAVTKSDTVDFAKLDNEYPRAVWVGGAGNAAIVTPDGVAVTYEGIAAGTLIPVQAKRVNSTNTTATLMVAIY